MNLDDDPKRIEKIPASDTHLYELVDADLGLYRGYGVLPMVGTGLAGVYRTRQEAEDHSSYSDLGGVEEIDLYVDPETKPPPSDLRIGLE